MNRWQKLIGIVATSVITMLGILYAAPANADTVEFGSASTKGYYAGGNLHWIGNMEANLFYSDRVHPGATYHEQRPCCDPQAGQIQVWGSGWNGNGNIPDRVRWAITSIRFYDAVTGDIFAVSTPQAQLNGCYQTNWIDPKGGSVFPWGQIFKIVNFNGHGSLINENFQTNCWSTSDVATGGYYQWHHGNPAIAIGFLCFNVAGSGTREPNCDNYPDSPAGSQLVAM